MNPTAKTKAQFACELGLSERTLRRRLKAIQYPLTGLLLSPEEQSSIRRALGYPPYIWAANDNHADNPL